MSTVTVLVMPGQDSAQNDTFEYSSVIAQVDRDAVRLTSIINIDGSGIDSILSTSYQLHSIQQLSAGQAWTSNLDMDSDSRRPYLALFTSGSTGQPKAVIVSQYAILNNRVVTSRYEDEKCTRYCIPLALHHAFGSTVAISKMAVNGWTLVLTGYKYSVSGFMRCMAQYECTGLAAVPTMTLDAIAYLTQNPDVESLVPSLTTVRRTYSLSEMGPVVTSSSIQDGAHFDHYGTVVGHVSVKLVDRATGETVPIGEPGLIKVRSPFRMIGYHNDLNHTGKLFDQDGYFDTGDMGSFDQNGRLFFVGRAKEIISRGGEKFHASEAENLLYQHDGICECAVVPVPDARLGQRALAWIRAVEGSGLGIAGVRQFLQQGLTSYKIPEYIVLTNDPLPRTGSGKISKTQVEALALQYMESMGDMEQHTSSGTSSGRRLSSA
ncbi:Medium-chain acyl-CoA ligase ACSF2, mitochondrial [Halotydeus destructor]|nr:Medium-chain acyl-CoA ligase ACSF2, mitochondrial [Halotydeus destructor]